MDEKFAAASTSAESEFDKRTVGLFSADEYRKARAEIVKQQAEEQKRAYVIVCVCYCVFVFVCMYNN